MGLGIALGPDIEAAPLPNVDNGITFVIRVMDIKLLDTDVTPGIPLFPRRMHNSIGFAPS